VVIFGFGPGQQEDLGEVAPVVCPNCHNQVFLHHVRSKKTVRLYFVPVVPYGTDDYLVCPICSRGLQLSRVQLSHVRSMSDATAAYRTGRLPEAQYQAQAAAGPPADDQAPWMSQLLTLSQLHEQGVLSDADYEAAKRRILDQK
jgi:uncharacterized protein YbaR (Trm112 family)